MICFREYKQKMLLRLAEIKLQTVIYRLIVPFLLKRSKSIVLHAPKRQNTRYPKHNEDELTYLVALISQRKQEKVILPTRNSAVPTLGLPQGSDIPIHFSKGF